jgi:hypothetical protein
VLIDEFARAQNRDHEWALVELVTVSRLLQKHVRQRRDVVDLRQKIVLSGVFGESLDA